jgi:uncharacterized protein involved in type VI secretion and phage assembly
MRWLTGALLMTGACTTPADIEPPVPEHGSTPGHRCDDSKAQALVGRTGTQELGGQALSLTGAGRLRWIRPGDAVTMDYRTDRLNIHLDARGRVERLSCG